MVLLTLFAGGASLHKAPLNCFSFQTSVMCEETLVTCSTQKLSPGTNYYATKKKYTLHLTFRFALQGICVPTIPKNPAVPGLQGKKRKTLIWDGQVSACNYYRKENCSNCNINSSPGAKSQGNVPKPLPIQQLWHTCFIKLQQFQLLRLELSMTRKISSKTIIQLRSNEKITELECPGIRKHGLLP